MASEAQIKAAYLRAIRSIVDGSQFVKLRDAISSGNYEAAISAVDIDDAAFDEFRALLIETYAQSGVNEVTGQKWPVSVRYNSASPYAERYAREVVGQHITYITEEMRNSVRWTIGDGVAFGRSFNRIALDIVGRIGPAGNRVGGIVGLNQQQSEWVANMRRYIQDGNIAAVKSMTRRDKRYDAMIERGGLTDAQIDKIVGRYSDRLLLSRGLTIARTERMLAVNQGRIDAWRQAADKVGIQHSALVKKWRHTGRAVMDRITHQLANGQTVQGLDTPFNIGGFLMQYPHDPAAPASQCINCMCEVDIKLPKGFRRGRS